MIGPCPHWLACKQACSPRTNQSLGSFSFHVIGFQFARACNCLRCNLWVFVGGHLSDSYLMITCVIATPIMCKKNGNLCNSNLQAIVLYKNKLSTQLFTARVLLQTLYKSMFATNTSKNNFCHQITLRMISTCFPIQGFCYSKVDFPRFLPANIFQLNCWPHQGRGRACSRR